MKTNIRHATTTDYSPLCELFEEVNDLHCDNLPHLFQKPKGPIRERDYYLELIADENVGLFVAETDGNVVGFLHAMIRDAPTISFFIPRRYVIVDGLGVKLGYQNQGIGRMLMETAHEWAITNGANSIELHVYEFNQQAIAFYEQLGYETFSRKMSRPLNGE